MAKASTDPQRRIFGASPNAGFNLVILGFVARLVGGPVNRPLFAGAVFGVIVLDQLAALMLPNQWRQMIVFGVLLLVIVARTRVRAARAD
jgi:branched-subunit amino acid ABC-type transport system permease component